MISEWHSVSLQSIHLGILCHAFKLHDCKIVIKPDLSDISLHIVNTFQLTADEFNTMLQERYNVCEDTHISCGPGKFFPQNHQRRIHIRSRPSHPSNVRTPRCPVILNVSLPGSRFCSQSSCPASGRFVHLDMNDNNHRIVIVDFLT